MTINVLPKEILFHALSFLESPKDLAACCGVNSGWNKAVSENDDLWKNLYKRIEVPKDVNAKKFIVEELTFTTLDEIIDRIDKIIPNKSEREKVPYSKITFECNFLHNPELFVEFSCKIPNSDGKPNITRTYTFRKKLEDTSASYSCRNNDEGYKTHQKGRVRSFELKIKLDEIFNKKSNN